MQTDLKEKQFFPADEEQIQSKRRTALNTFFSGDRTTAWYQLKDVVNDLLLQRGTEKIDSMLVSSSLDFANLSFLLGKGFKELIDIMFAALKAATRIGDRRSHALINLHLGRLLYFAEQRQAAMSAFLSGKNEVEELGDQDIHKQASEFIGLFYFIQGRFLEAVNYLETAAQSFEMNKSLNGMNPSGPLWFSYCLAFLGEFHRAIGTLDYYRRLAVEYELESIACTLRAALGIILLGIKKKKEAYYHLSGALKHSHTYQNALASYFSKGGIALHHFMENRLNEAAEWLEQTMVEGRSCGLIHQYASPIILEILFGLHQEGLLKESSFNYEKEYKRTLQEPNIHLRGVALRLYAREGIESKEPLKPIESALIQSEKNLKRAGDPIQLGKTRLEIARVKLLNGNRKEAYEAAQKARKDFGSYEDVFFSDDLRPLITVKADSGLEIDSKSQMLHMFADVIQEFSPSPDFDRLLGRIVLATNRFFGAERGGIFWFNQDANKEPLLRGACDLSEADIASEKFKANLALIFTAYHEKCPQVVRCQTPPDDVSSVKAMLCVPLSIKGTTYGVLYHDNSYLKDCFDNFDIDKLSEMSRWLSSYIAHFFEFAKNIQKRDAHHLKQLSYYKKSHIVTQSPIMFQLLEEADKSAESDSSVMILGETGVGKELVARRIHEMSLRAEKPYIIVDLSAIPENLVESELFGHEKGAFTGADRQKKGKIELAHMGTLFIDEVAEIPKSIQVKLLRTLQEKTFNRIGGNDTKHSDFRLITATNRNLAAEVTAGRFREDLFYRLNVIPLTIPPLRDRPEDIILIARHLLDQFVYKYNKKGIELNQKHEAMLRSHDWPGNIRELQNTMERAVLLAKGGNLSIDLPLESLSAQEKEYSDLPTLEEMQRRYIRKVMFYTNGKISGPGGAAEILGMKRTTLLNRMKKLGLK